MGGEYDFVPLGEVASVRSGFAFKSGDWTETGIPVVKIANVKDGRLAMESCSFVPQSIAESAAEFALQAGDILIAMTGYIGDVARVSERDLPAVLNQRVGRFTIREPQRLDRGFLFYLLRDADVRKEIEGLGYGSAQPNVSPSLIHSVEVPLPPLAEQRAIAHILGTLDDKIELNRRMSETLEAMARALFKSWFVDFDPVRAKAEGRDPGLPKPLADLFPARLVDSELGEIPEGWEGGSVYEIADVIYGAPFSSAQFNTGGIGEPLIRIRDLPTESPSVWTPEKHPKGYKVRSGDVVVGMDGEFRAYLWGGAEGWLNQRTCVFKPKSGVSAAFVRNAIMQPLSDVESTETATTVIHLGKADIDRFKLVMPSPALRKHFDGICQPWYDRIVAAKQETRTLAALRDTLLPKLISGELRVKDAEPFMERV